MIIVLHECPLRHHTIIIHTYLSYMHTRGRGVVGGGGGGEGDLIDL